MIRVDSRGAGRSPGRRDVFSPGEIADFAEAIEWAGTRSWSTAKAGLNDISYYAITQWQVAVLQPPHLAAIIPWEGAGDYYRDVSRHGGIASNVFTEWFNRRVASVRHGNADASTRPMVGRARDRA
ncbi:CocE/NonD family hydrolase [Amycolatopsis pithecellobii]|uniref:CocE/NonD family hydrolase n=1 Tax=Amycolatopsis pithecellobii TaxID=664692 RepID=UPI0028A727ED|nr:CocE/NonD family hydrolase [Amycolatopsis pithecellobii]